FTHPKTDCLGVLWLRFFSERVLKSGSIQLSSLAFMFICLRLATWQRLAKFQITRGIVWRLPVAVS
ncbi:MAG TPA: hypothetical protein ACHBY5_14015, partial [Arsenophonus apicola]